MIEFSTHLNQLADKYSPLQVGPLSPPKNLQMCAISVLFKSIQEQILDVKNLKEVCKVVGIQEKIILSASNFNDLMAVKEFLTDDVAQQLLNRFQFSRKFFEKEANAEILLKGIFLKIFQQSSYQEKIEMIEKKRNLSIIDSNTYSLINRIERAQAIIGRMMGSMAAKITLTLLMLATAAVALYALYLVRPDIAMKTVLTYLKILNSIPIALDATQPYRYFSLILAVLSGIAYRFIGSLSPNVKNRMEIIGVFSGLHWICSETAAFLDIPLSTILEQLFRLVPNGSAYLLLPYLAPIVYPILAAIYTADSSSSLASRTLNVTSKKLEVWRVNRELQEVRDLWVQSFLNKAVSVIQYGKKEITYGISADENPL